MPVSVTFIQGQSLVKLYVHSSQKLKRSQTGEGTQLPTTAVLHPFVSNGLSVSGGISSLPTLPSLYVSHTAHTKPRRRRHSGVTLEMAVTWLQEGTRSGKVLCSDTFCNSGGSYTDRWKHTNAMPAERVWMTTRGQHQFIILAALLDTR